jgi:hypothetical protein
MRARIPLAAVVVRASMATGALAIVGPKRGHLTCVQQRCAGSPIGTNYPLKRFFPERVVPFSNASVRRGHGNPCSSERRWKCL